MRVPICFGMKLILSISYYRYHFLDINLRLCAIYDLKFDLHLVDESSMSIDVQLVGSLIEVKHNVTLKALQHRDN